MEHVHVIPTVLCFRCSAEVPNGIVKHRTMQIGHDKSTWHIFAHTERFELVSLCGPCDVEVAEEQRLRRWERCRFWGVVAGTIALTSAGIIWPVSLAVMCGMAWFRVTALSLVAMLLISKGVQVETLPPAQYVSYFVFPWAIVASGLIGARWYVENKKKLSYAGGVQS